jgi:hypothetical protein
MENKIPVSNSERNPTNAFHKGLRIEVHEQGDPQAGQLQIGQNLGIVNGLKSLDRFKLQ